MSIDLFSLIDGIFRGLVLFIHSFVQTTSRIIRHPMRGALQSYSHYANPEIRQVGPWTFLFIAFFVAILLWSNYSQTDLLSTSSYLSSKSTEHLLLPSALGALVSSAGVDALCRLMLLRRSWESRRRRERRIALLEYTFALVPLSFAALWMVVLLLDEHIGSAWELPILATSLILGTVPVLRVGTSLVGSAQHWSRSRLIATSLLGVLISVAVLTLALTVGFLVAAATDRARQPPLDLVVTALTCDVRTEPTRVTVVFFNPTPRPQFIRRNDRWIILKEFSASEINTNRHFMAVDLDAASEIDLGVAPNTSIGLRGFARRKRDFPTAQATSCFFEDDKLEGVVEKKE